MTITVTNLKTITMIAVMALVIRMVAFMAVGWDKQFPAPDQSLYHSVAKSIFAGKGFQVNETPVEIQSNQVEGDSVRPGYWDIIIPNRPTAYFTPVYPVMMAVAYGIFGDHPGAPRLFQVLFDALACFLIGWMGLRMFGSRQGILAALIYSVFPPFIALTLVLWPTSLLVFTLLLAMALTVNFQDQPLWWSALLMGMAWGLATLSLPALLPLLLVVVLLAWWDIARLRSGKVGTMGERLRMSPHLQWIYPLIIAGGMVVILSPWALRNAVVMGHFSISSTKEGLSLYKANNGIFAETDIENPVSTDDMDQQYHNYAVAHVNQLHRKDLIEFPKFPLEMSEFRRSSILTKRVIEFVSANPKVAAELCALRLYSLVRIPPSFLTFPTWKLIGFIATIVVLVFGILGLILDLDHWSRASYFYLLFLYYIVIYAIAEAGIPQRLPLIAILVLFAAGSLVWIFERISGSSE